MAIGIYEIHGNGRRTLISTHNDFNEARRVVLDDYKVDFIENDALHTDCADFLTIYGEQYVIQPVTGDR